MLLYGGGADPGEKVSVAASWGESASVITDDSGKWQVTLLTPKASLSDSYKLTFKGKNELEINNILVGEVWLASGQSNMAFTIKSLKLSKVQIGETNFTGIREFKVKRQSSQELIPDVIGQWIAASDESVPQFSGTAFFFARTLHQSLNIPIGIVNSSWGGTPIESWLSVASQKNHLITQEKIQKLDKWATVFNADKVKNRYEQELLKWQADKKQAQQLNRSFKQRKPKLAQHPHKSQRYPSSLYDGMINPIKSYAVKGTIWYQGEANSNSLAQANFYQTQLFSLITSWREDWHNAEMPFYVVQLANFKAEQVKPVENEQFWPVTRESMRKATQELAYTDIAVAIDIGAAKNIHPQNKMELGRRLALKALDNDYHKNVISSGPIYKSYIRKGDKIILEFEPSSSEFIVKEGGKLKGFAIKGESGSFVWAEAKIISTMAKNNSTANKQFIEVWHKDVPSPTGVKYGWANNPAEINLYNKAGLPASPFSTD